MVNNGESVIELRLALLQGLNNRGGIERRAAVFLQGRERLGGQRSRRQPEPELTRGVQRDQRVFVMQPRLDLSLESSRGHLRALHLEHPARCKARHQRAVHTAEINPAPFRQQHRFGHS